MALIMNQTGVVIATGQWQKIAGAGDCVIECNQTFEDALTADEVTVPTSGHLHAAANVHRNDNQSSWNIPSGGSVWVKGPLGASFVITANSPEA